MADGTQPKRRRNNNIPRYIYGLMDEAGSFRYIGQTSNVAKRLRYHWDYRETNKSQRRLMDWLMTLDEPPHVMVLEAVTSKDADAAERKWISRVGATNDLLNMTNRPDWNAKGRQAAWRKTTGATRPKVSAAVREAWRTGRKTGHPMPDETRRKISEAQRGRPFTEEHKRALRKAKGRQQEGLF